MNFFSLLFRFIFLTLHCESASVLGNSMLSRAWEAQWLKMGFLNSVSTTFLFFLLSLSFTCFLLYFDFSFRILSLALLLYFLVFISQIYFSHVCLNHRLISRYKPTWHCDGSVEIHEAGDKENSPEENAAVGMKKTHCETNQDWENLKILI